MTLWASGVSVGMETGRWLWSARRPVASLHPVPELFLGWVGTRRACQNGVAAWGRTLVGPEIRAVCVYAVGWGCVFPCPGSLGHVLALPWAGRVCLPWPRSSLSGSGLSLAGVSVWVRVGPFCQDPSMPGHARLCYHACLEDPGSLFGSTRPQGWCHCHLRDRRVKHPGAPILTMSLHGGCHWTGRVQLM